MPYSPVFQLGVFNGARDIKVTQEVMTVMLDALTAICEKELIAYPDIPLLYKAGVKYYREPFGDDPWQDVLTTRSVGYGDCEDLSAWRAAELRVRYGIKAVCEFSHIVTAQEQHKFHIFVRFPPGIVSPYTGTSIEDPSLILGMKSPSEESNG